MVNSRHKSIAPKRQLLSREAEGPALRSFGNLVFIKIKVLIPAVKILEDERAAVQFLRKMPFHE